MHKFAQKILFLPTFVKYKKAFDHKMASPPHPTISIFHKKDSIFSLILFQGYVIKVSQVPISQSIKQQTIVKF